LDPEVFHGLFCFVAFLDFGALALDGFLAGSHFWGFWVDFAERLYMVFLARI